jgi:hypothetical protein
MLSDQCCGLGVTDHRGIGYKSRQRVGSLQCHQLHHSRGIFPQPHYSGEVKYTQELLIPQTLRNFFYFFSVV